jgi:hypothetical protein
MESLFGMPYLKSGDITLKLLHRHQEDVRKSLITGLPSAPVCLRTLPAKLADLVEAIKMPKVHPLAGLLHPR